MPDISKEGSKTARELRRWLKILIVMTVLLYLILAGFGYVSWILSNRNTDALCSLRQDVERRIETSQQFLIDNPRGIPGIEPRVIRQQIQNNQRTVRALNSLNCPSIIKRIP